MEFLDPAHSPSQRMTKYERRVGTHPPPRARAVGRDFFFSPSFSRLACASIILVRVSPNKKHIRFQKKNMFVSYSFTRYIFILESVHARFHVFQTSCTQDEIARGSSATRAAPQKYASINHLLGKCHLAQLYCHRHMRGLKRSVLI